MAYSFLVYDFGSNEEAAQQARRKVEGWKQAFRLGNKVLLKFERTDDAAGAAAGASGAGEEKAEAKSKGKSGHARKGLGGSDSSSSPKKSAEKNEEAASNERIRMLIRLDFSDHEKLSHNRWIEQIPAGEPFKSAHGEIVRAGDAEFQKTSELYDSLD